LYSCDAGAVEILIVHENLETERFVVSTPEGDKVLYLTAEQCEKQDNFKDPKTGQDYEVTERILLIEWLAENYKKFGCSLQFVTDRSQEGMQFVKGFGGIGALLRYKLDFNTLDEDEARKDEDDEYDFFY
jgi:peptide chain release factor subunit 1